MTGGTPISGNLHVFFWALGGCPNFRSISVHPAAPFKVVTLHEKENLTQYAVDVEQLKDDPDRQTGWTQQINRQPMENGWKNPEGTVDGQHKQLDFPCFAAGRRGTSLVPWR